MSGGIYIFAFILWGDPRRAGGLSNFLLLDVFSLRKSIPIVFFFLNPDSLKSLVHFLL